MISTQELSVIVGDWVEVLDSEKISPYFWGRCFRAALRERKYLTAPFQPAEVCSTWRKYGSDWVRVIAHSMPESEFMPRYELKPEEITESENGRHFICPLPHGYDISRLQIFLVEGRVPVLKENLARDWVFDGDPSDSEYCLQHLQKKLDSIRSENITQERNKIIRKFSPRITKDSQ